MEHNLSMSDSYANKVLQLTESRGLLRSRDLDDIGVPRVTLTRLVRVGQLNRVGRGLYALPNRNISENESLIMVARKVPKSVFCLLTALRFHNITTQSPFEVWVAITRQAGFPKLEYPSLRVARFSGDALTEGVEKHNIDGVEIKVYNLAKTVADCFKFRNKIGLDVAIEALHEGWREKRIKMDDIWKYAKICRVANVMRPYLESLP